MFKKALMAFAAVTAVSAAFAATSFAALTADTDFANGKVTISEGLADFTADDQVTVLLIEKGADADGITEDEILYINQAAGNGANDIFGDMGVLGGSLDEAKTYVLKVGSDTGADIMEFEIAAPAEDEKDVWGDVDANYVVDADDVTRLVRHTSGAEALTYAEDELVARCDVTLEGVVDADDVTRLVRHTSGAEVLEGMVDNKAQ